MLIGGSGGINSLAPPMAVNLLAILVICKAIFTVALNLEPPELLGPHTDDPTRWPYGGCAEVVKIYPAPGSHLPPPPEIYADDWNVTITVVFSRPVTRILWDYDIRIWLRNVSLSKDSKWLRHRPLSTWLKVYGRGNCPLRRLLKYILKQLFTYS